MYGMHFYFHVWFIYTTNLFSRIVLHELFIFARDCLRFLSFGHTILHNSLIVTFEFPRTIHFTRAIFTQFTCDFSNDIFFTRNFYTDGLSLVFFFFINVSSFPPVIHIFSHIIFTQNKFYTIRLFSHVHFSCDSFIFQNYTHDSFTFTCRTNGFIFSRDFPTWFIFFSNFFSNEITSLTWHHAFTWGHVRFQARGETPVHILFSRNHVYTCMYVKWMNQSWCTWNESCGKSVN